MYNFITDMLSGDESFFSTLATLVVQANGSVVQNMSKVVPENGVEDQVSRRRTYSDRWKLANSDNILSNFYTLFHHDNHANIVYSILAQMYPMLKWTADTG